ncbi:MAG: glutamate 5-kinase [Myxococcales bacterium]|nr:glutamate 5-kinase [Myxococcales bacterium]
MHKSENPRASLRETQSLVVKVGSRLLSREDAPDRFDAIARQIAAVCQQGQRVTLVSSGAITLGHPVLGLKTRPRHMALLQASAAVGQPKLMESYDRAFAKYQRVTAQVLLTRTGLLARERYLNARAALESLLERGIVPIVNENDTVSVEEIAFGDNDSLAATVTALVSADLLVLLTSVEGVLDDQKERISVVHDVNQVLRFVSAETSGTGVGGMSSKLLAAHAAAKHGVPVIIAAGQKNDILSRVLNGDDVGTLILPQGGRRASRKHWIAYTLHPTGSIIVDAGAAQALIERNSSLLPAGIVRVEGAFHSGESVRILDTDGHELARGLSRYNSEEVASLVGAQSTEIIDRIGRDDGHEVVHRDDMVVI